MKQTLEEAAKSMAYDKMPDWGGLPAVAKKYFIKGAEWQSKQSPWISVKERLPERMGITLLLTVMLLRKFISLKDGISLHQLGIILIYFTMKE